jgi:hypothetical protein
MIGQSNTKMNFELNRDRSVVSKHTTRCLVQYTVLTVAFSPVFFCFFSLFLFQVELIN